MTGPRCRSDRGSALFLFPAAALVVVVLASIAVDFGMLHVRQRELWMAADAAANDAASWALDEAHLRASGEVRLVAERAWQAAAEAVQGSGIEGLQLDAVELGGDGREVTVTVSLETSLIIGRGLPGNHARRLTATRHRPARGRAAARSVEARFGALRRWRGWRPAGSAP